MLFTIEPSTNGEPLLVEFPKKLMRRGKERNESVEEKLVLFGNPVEGEEEDKKESSVLKRECRIF